MKPIATALRNFRHTSMIFENKAFFVFLLRAAQLPDSSNTFPSFLKEELSGKNRSLHTIFSWAERVFHISKRAHIDPCAVVYAHLRFCLWFFDHLNSHVKQNELPYQQRMTRSSAFCGASPPSRFSASRNLFVPVMWGKSSQYEKGMRLAWSSRGKSQPLPLVIDISVGSYQISLVVVNKSLLNNTKPCFKLIPLIFMYAKFEGWS